MTDEKKKILLVDDNHDILDLLEIYLYRNYEIVTALNGFEGMQKVKSEKPDCIITDIMMPVMDGIKFFNNIRKLDNMRLVPVIGITSFTKKVSKKSLINMGFSQVLAKPLSREIVWEAVKRVLNPRHGDAR